MDNVSLQALGVLIEIVDFESCQKSGRLATLDAIADLLCARQRPAREAGKARILVKNLTGPVDSGTWQGD